MVPAVLVSLNRSTTGARANAKSEAVWCICRKPDNHQWMIACDGGCNDWFHGSCVNVREDEGALIDRYICPSCETENLKTTWRRMCRFPTCRRPARVGPSLPVQSKYCSDDHGREHMKQLVRAMRIKAVPQIPDITKPPSNNDSHNNNDGILSAPSLAAVVSNVRDAAALKQLGEGVASIPSMELPADGSADPLAAFALCAERYAADERRQIARLCDARERAKTQLYVLQNWKAFVLMVNEQAARLAEDACGYDERLAWSDAQFCAWGASAAGQAAVAAGTLAVATALTTAPAESGGSLDDTPAATAAEATETAEAAEGPCQMRRCERHKGWRTQKLQEIRFEQSLAKAEIDRLSREALEIMYRANIRQISRANNGALEGYVEEIAG